MATDNLLNLYDVPIPCGLIRDGIVFKNSFFDTPQDAPIDNIVFDHSGEAMVLTDKDDDIVKVNGAFKTVFGYDEPDILMKNPSFLRDGLNQVELIKKAFSEIEKVVTGVAKLLFGKHQVRLFILGNQHLQL